MTWAVDVRPGFGDLRPVGRRDPDGRGRRADLGAPRLRPRLRHAHRRHELFYKVDGDYAPQLEGGLIWNDPDLAIAWPLDGDPVLSDKDKLLPRLKDMPKAEF